MLCLRRGNVFCGQSFHLHAVRGGKIFCGRRFVLYGMLVGNLCRKRRISLLYAVSGRQEFRNGGFVLLELSGGLFCLHGQCLHGMLRRLHAAGRILHKDM